MGGILTLNAGSSSLKFALFGQTGEAPGATGLADRIGPEGSLKIKDGAGAALPVAGGSLATHAEALRCVLTSLQAAFPGTGVAAVGHRVVHGGPDRAAPVRLDAALLDDLATVSPFAPLHQPHNLAGIRAEPAGGCESCERDLVDGRSDDAAAGLPGRGAIRLECARSGGRGRAAVWSGGAGKPLYR